MIVNIAYFVIAVICCLRPANAHELSYTAHHANANRSRSAVRSFTIDYDKNTFLKDGVPFRYISGSIHYSRVPRYYWRDRLMKMYAAGLNAVQVYVPWNYHEIAPGIFDWSGEKDIVEFLRIVQDVGLLVILRPGPYICAEWEFGGLPPWLLTYNASMNIRTTDPGYMQHVYRFTERMYDYLYPWTYAYGGPIIMIQVENEYGSWYACDLEYLRLLMIQNRERMGHDTVLFTTDGDGAGFLKCGALKDEMFATVDFGPTGNVSAAFQPQLVFNDGRGPMVNSEYYVGWLDRWGEPHSHTDSARVATTLDDMLALGANVNMYMFHGGTNFGYWNGAGGWPYVASLTSYDYDAPLSEAGDVTEKYVVIRNVIAKYNKLPEVPVPPNTLKYAYGSVKLTLMATLQDALTYLSPGSPVYNVRPLNMEALNHYYGFILYRHAITQNYTSATLNISGIRDRGYIMINKVPVGLITVNGPYTVQVTANVGDVLDILVENQGRINYDRAMLGQIKGIISPVLMNGHVLNSWFMYPLDLDKAASRDLADSTLRWSAGPHVSSTAGAGAGAGAELHEPALYSGGFTMPNTNSTVHPQDTFINMKMWTKGQVYVNEYNLGRYWPGTGPQITLFVPACYLKPYPQVNTVLVFELEKSACGAGGAQDCSVTFVNTPVINGPTTKRIPMPKSRQRV